MLTPIILLIENFIFKRIFFLPIFTNYQLQLHRIASTFKNKKKTNQFCHHKYIHKYVHIYKKTLLFKAFKIQCIPLNLSSKCIQSFIYLNTYTRMQQSSRSIALRHIDICTYAYIILLQISKQINICYIRTFTFTF